MSISSEITRITDNIADAYTAVSGKGGTLPSARNSANLPAAIASITPAKTEQSKTLTLGAAAPATVTPDSGKVLSSVPVVLDTSVIKAENIAKDVTMLGVTGTHEGGGRTFTVRGDYYSGSQIYGRGILTPDGEHIDFPEYIGTISVPEGSILFVASNGPFNVEVYPDSGQPLKEIKITWDRIGYQCVLVDTNVRIS